MNFKVNYLMILFVIGVLTGLTVVFLIRYLSRKKWGPCEYDERQMLVRGKAFKAAFLTLVIYLSVDGLLSAFTEIRWANTFVVDYIGIGLALEVYAIICILKDAYFPLREKPGRYLTLFGILIVCSGFVSLAGYLDGEPFITDGMLNYRSINPVIFVAFTGIFIALAVRRAADKKRSDEE